MSEESRPVFFHPSASASLGTHYKVETAIDFNNGLIRQELIMPDLQGIERAVTRWIMQTRENQIRSALIKLGWTPPSSVSLVPSVVNSEKEEA